MFWDGDPSTQSFIRVVGLSSRRVSGPECRPASAPARQDHVSGCSPRQRRTHNQAGREISRHSFDAEGPGVDGDKQHRATSRHDRSYRHGDVERGRMMALEHRLRQLTRENARMRDAIMDGAEVSKLERMGGMRTRNLDTAATRRNGNKDGGEQKSRRSQQQCPVRARFLYFVLVPGIVLSLFHSSGIVVCSHL